MDQYELTLDPRHVGVPSGGSKMISKPMYVHCKPYTYPALTLTLSPNRQNELSLYPWHLRVPSGAPKMISEPIACSVQTMYLSSVKINTISKQTKTSFHFTHGTYEFHQVHPKWFLSLLHVQCKPCTYLVSRLTLSPNGLKWASAWPSSCSSSIRCVQNDFPAYGPFDANRAPILCWD
jgi:hypothetical protein